MLFLIAAVYVCIFMALFRRLLKEHPWPFYLLALAVSLTISLLPIKNAPEWVRVALLDPLRTGALSCAFFAVVMYTGALKNGSQLMRLLIPVRDELSIIASLLVAGHCIYLGKTYLPALFTAPGFMPKGTLISMVCAILLIVLLLPLFVTFFPRIRKSLGAKRWKRLQRLAYGFYGLTWLHILLINMPMGYPSGWKQALNLVVYSGVFLVYLLLLLRKKAILSRRTREHQA